MSVPVPLRRARIAAFVRWLHTVEHPHWEQPGFAAFSDLTDTERLDAARIFELQAAEHQAHADELERILLERTGGTEPRIGNPPAFKAEGHRIAVGANAGEPYSHSIAGGNANITLRAMIEGAVLLVIDALDITDGEADAEEDDPAEDDDPDGEHDGREPEDGQ